MKKTLQAYLRSLLLSGMFLMLGTGAYANHISAMDLSYTFVSSTGSGATMSSIYQVTITIYGNCSDTTGSYATLPESSPQVCVFNGATSVSTLNLTLQGPGVNVTNVCAADTGLTTCTSTSNTIAGNEKYVYSATVTLTGTSQYWRFIYTGYNGTGAEAGRSSQITTLVGTSTLVHLIDTLNNTNGSNTSTSLPIIPTPYYCAGDPDNYNPGATNADGDSLVFQSVTPLIGSATCTSTTGTDVDYDAGISAAAPISGATGYSFSSTNGQISFTSTVTQTTVVDYNIREFRAGVLVGTCQREMNISVRPCTSPAPTGNMRTPTDGAITSDSTTFEACENTGIFSFTIAASETDTAYDITMTASNIPTGATYSIANDSTNHPVATFTWTSTGTTPGTYTFDILYASNNCPVTSTGTIAYNVIIEPVPSAITGTTTVCTGESTTLADALTGGTWSSSNTSVATAGSSSGTIYGVSSDLDTITYSYSAAACNVTTTVNVTGPKAITGTLTVCPTLTSDLAETVTGGVWSSSNTAVATVGTSGIVTGVAGGTANISYTITSTGCFVIAPVTVTALAAITPASAVVCTGNTVNLTDATSGGIWSSSSTTIATVTSGGIVHGVASGSVDIFYTLGSCYATAAVSVSATGPAAITDAAGATTCVGSTLALTDASTGGTWSSSTTGVAAVNSTTGVVTGVATGAATISYFLGGCYVTIPVTIISGIAAITPATSEICIANTENLAETTTGGVWSSNATAVATVGSTGKVSGVTAGIATISYSIGACYALSTVTVSAGPGAITPVPVTICQGTAADLIDATSGGTWSSSNSTVASVVGGTVTGATTGTATISYTEAGCAATTVVTVVATPAAILPASALICTGNTVTLTESVTGGAWSSGNTAVASVTSGLVNGIGAGTATISYASGSCIVTAIVTVDLAPNPGLISGASVVCIGGTTDLTDAVSSGVWSSSNTAAATVNTSGVVTGVATGTTTISYSLTVACGTVPTTHVVSVDVAPTAGTITGSASVCSGTTDLLSDVVTGGTWSASNTHATVSSVSGLVTGVSAGLDTIKYTITSSCGTVSTTMSVTVGAFLSAGTITGTVNSICAGATLSVADATTGGTWSSSNGSATVNSSGLVTGATGGGLDTIEYTVTSSCGAAVATYPITVNPIPAAAVISGSSVLCVGSSALFTDASTGGVWSSSNTANATVNSASGLVTGAALGTATISYTISNSCGTSVAVTTVTMSALVSAGTISGPTSVCIGSTIPLVDATGSGAWSSSNTSAEVSGGVVTGLAAGTDTIYYTVTTGCGTAVASQVITVNSSVSSAGSIVGLSSVCVSSLITLTDPTASGGDWSSSNSHATITTGGEVTGISPGTDTISYTITSTCGIASATKVITISALSSVGAISGSPTICVGVSTTFTDATTGGVWSSLDGNATVGSTSGLVTGVSVGSDVISYSVTSACGTYGTTMGITISGSATAGSITGPDSVCVGATITLTDAVSGGVWSSSNTDVALIGGAITGVAAGSSLVSYTVTNSCGTVVAVDLITISPTASAGTISGASTVCAGLSVTLTDAATGGTWLASNTHASVTGAGIIDGLTGGVDTIFYEVTNSCGTSIASKIISVHPAASVDAIVGPTHQCTGALSDILLLDATTGGVWSSSNTAIATINDITGVITGTGIGVATLSYSVSSGSGCSTVVTSLDTVMATPALSPIAGSSAVCIGSTTLLTDASTGGAWSSSDAGTATINPVTGLVGGIATGTVIISYSVENSCGNSYVVMAEIVDAMPTVGSITGTTTICVGSTVTLADASTGGTWSSGNTAVATADVSSGAITGVSPGTAIIDYNYSGTCPVTIPTVVTVITGPAIDPITGTTSECIGTSTSLADGTGLGVWSSSNTAIATVSTAGLVSGITAGTATISYTVASGVGCSVSSIATYTVLGIPAESAITGAAAICAGANLTLSNASPDGTWSSANTAVAVINALTGQVTGVSGGTDKIYYTISDICGSALDSTTITINAGPVVNPIGAAFTTLCRGTTVTLTETGTTGGVWSSNHTAIATVNAATGVVTGVSGGTDTVRYTVTNTDGCSGSAMISLNISGSVLSAAISPVGSVTICHGIPIAMDVVGTSGTGATYQWLLNGGAITGATNSGYTATSVGAYTAAIDNGTCSETIPGPTVIAPPNPIILFTAPATLYTGSFPSYQWYLNEVAIAGADASSVIVSGAGTYKVAVTDINHCTDTSGGYIVTAHGISGVNTVTNPQNVKVYPNPATSVLYIDAPMNVNVTVMSIDGKVVISKKDVTSIDVSTLADGMYMVMVYDQNDLLIKATKFAKVQ